MLILHKYLYFVHLLLLDTKESRGVPKNLPFLFSVSCDPVLLKGFERSTCPCLLEIFSVHPGNAEIATTFASYARVL